MRLHGVNEQEREMGLPAEAQAKAVGQVKFINVHDDPIFRTLKRNERLVYETLRKSPAPLKAYDLLEQLQEDGLRAPMTIYRALEALISKGFVKKIASLNAFAIITPARESGVRAFVICRDCMRAKEVVLDEKRVADLFTPLEVAADNLTIEVVGECHQVCRE